ncbi:hypothetical protein MAR_015168, partial [Mya arenaria]
MLLSLKNLLYSHIKEYNREKSRTSFKYKVRKNTSVRHVMLPSLHKVIYKRVYDYIHVYCLTSVEHVKLLYLQKTQEYKQAKILTSVEHMMLLFLQTVIHINIIEYTQ